MDDNQTNYRSLHGHNGGAARFARKDAVWKRNAELVMEICLKEDGLSVAEIAQRANLSPTVVKAIVSRAALRKEAEAKRKEITQAVMVEKVPLLKEIVGLSLTTVKEFLETLSKDEDRKADLTVADVKGLATIGKELNEMLRLELGQATQNVQVVQYSYTEAKNLLDNLRKLDPVLEYPELEDVEAITYTESPSSGTSSDNDGGV